MPNPPVSPNASKLQSSVYDNAGTNAAAGAKSVKQTTVNSEVLGHMGVGTHKDTDTYAAGDACVLVAGINGTDILPLALDASGRPTVNVNGAVPITDNAGSITVDGTVSISGTVTTSISGTPNVAVTSISAGNNNIGDVDIASIAAGNNNIGDVDIASIAAGTNTIGAVLDEGWDTAGKAVQRGLAQEITATTEQTLLSADASNLYNVTQVTLTWFSGSAAPAAMRKIQFRLGAAGTIFHTEYVPIVANQVQSITIQFKQPMRTTTNQAVTVQLNGALGTAGEYSASVLAYKTTS